MKKNYMTKSVLFAYAQKWAGGITKHTAVLQLVRNPATPLLSLLGNGRQTELEFQVARSVTLEASNQSFGPRTLRLGRGTVYSMTSDALPGPAMTCSRWGAEVSLT